MKHGSRQLRDESFTSGLKGPSVTLLPAGYVTMQIQKEVTRELCTLMSDASFKTARS